LYKTILGNKALDDGERLVSKLENRGMRVTAALWRFLEDELIWRLVIASPCVDSNGALRGYMDVMKALEELGDSVQLTVSDVSVISPISRDFRDLRRAIEAAGMDRVAGRQALSPEGITFEDFYTYRWNPELM
jgi:hypothetical protein